MTKVLAAEERAYSKSSFVVWWLRIGQLYMAANLCQKRNYIMAMHLNHCQESDSVQIAINKACVYCFLTRAQVERKWVQSRRRCLLPVVSELIQTYRRCGVVHTCSTHKHIQFVDMVLINWNESVIFWLQEDTDSEKFASLKMSVSANAMRNSSFSLKLYVTIWT